MAPKSRQYYYYLPQTVQCRGCAWQGKRKLKPNIQYGPCPQCGGLLVRRDMKQERRFQKAQQELQELRARGAKL